MVNSFQKLLVGISVLAGVGTLAGTPAFAATLTSASVSGGQFKVFLPNGSVTGSGAFELSEVAATDANALDAVTDPDGTLASPGGNVELFSDSEGSSYDSLAEFLTAPRTTLETVFDNGTVVTFTSLNGEDFFGATPDYTYGAANLANEWFNAAFEANLPTLLSSSTATLLGATDEASLFAALSASVPTLTGRGALFNLFLNAGGFQRAADPNIAFVNLDDAGHVSYGLAGHIDLLFYTKGTTLANLFSDVDVRASELVKVAVNGAPVNESVGANDGVLYSFLATPSNVVSDDNTNSFTATYDPGTIQVPSESVPEPTTLLGLLAVAGVGVMLRRGQALPSDHT